MDPHRSRRTRRPIRSLPAALLVLGVVGLFAACANLDGVKQFAAGVDGLARTSDDFYRRQADADLRLRLAVVDLADDPWDKALGGDALASEARRHRAAVAALQVYAQGLNELATVSESKEIEAAATELSGAFTSLSATLTGTAITDESALATAFTAVARAYVDLKAQRAIRKAALAAQPHVEVILATLRQDIARQQQRLLQVQRLAASSRRELLYEGLRKGFATASPAEQAMRTMAAQGLMGEELEARRIDPGDEALLRQFRAAVDSCLTAHGAIAGTSAQDAIPTFVKRVRDLAATIQRLAKS